MQASGIAACTHSVQRFSSECKLHGLDVRRQRDRIERPAPQRRLDPGIGGGVLGRLVLRLRVQRETAEARHQYKLLFVQPMRPSSFHLSIRDYQYKAATTVPSSPRATPDRRMR